jgi:predicted acylesterase/phospholipase RssA
VSDLAEVDYAAATRECDIVMKGGITSGVVYPHAVCELAQSYRFKSVGGTSAGAIAAAATAAAELGRAGGGFNRLAKLPAWIGAGRNLLDLFQPQPRTRRLYAVVRSAASGGPVRALVAAALHYLPVALLLLAPGVALAVLALLDGDGLLRWWALAAGVLLTLGGLLFGLPAFLAWRATRLLPENGYGFCNGAPGEGGALALTPWLTDLLDDLAGKPEGAAPVTFGELRAAGVELAMMTTNVTTRSARRLPWEEQTFYFDPDELRALFPERVVAHLEKHPPPGTGDLRPLLPLPAADDLPVVVATRMSLSFPVLLSAVPLHRVDWTSKLNRERDAAGQPPIATRHWFSDGGISSNFPVHFFDAAIPRRPTFAINLRPFHPDEAQSANEADNVWMPERNSGGLQEWTYGSPARGRIFDPRLPAFLSAIVRTMQNRSDEAQLRLPGYRDRIAHVCMTKQQGGLNLDMPAAVLDVLTRRGRAAGAKLAQRFAPDPPPEQELTWDNHRWVRLRSSVPLILQAVERLSETYSDAAHAPTYAELLARDANTPPGSYRLESAARAEQAAAVMTALTELAGALPDPAPFDHRPPRPRPDLRFVPRD